MKTFILYAGDLIQLENPYWIYILCYLFYMTTTLTPNYLLMVVLFDA